MMIATYEPTKPGRHLNVREEPSPAAKVVGAIEAGSVPCEGVDHGWAWVVGGYADARFLTVAPGDDTAEQPEPEPEAAPEPSLAETPDADGEDRDRLMGMTNAELYRLAEQSGIKVAKGSKKAELVEAILNGADE